MNSSQLTKIIAMAGMLSAGCGVRQYTQVEIAYGQGEYYPQTGRLDLVGGRLRHGVIERNRKEEIEGLQTELEEAQERNSSQVKELQKELEEAQELEASRNGRREEVRIGVDVFYATLPDKIKETPSPIVAQAYLNQVIPPIIETTESERITVSPALEYKLGSVGANFPSYAPLRDTDLKDVSLSLWAGIGYNVDLTVQNKSYSTPLGPFDDIPGFKLDGNPYFVFTQELEILKIFTLGISEKVDFDGNVTPIISGGGRVPWFKF